MRRVRWGRALAAGVLGSLALTAVSPAHAAWVKSYDGSWSVSLVSDAEDIFDGHNVLLDPAHDDLSISENDQVVQLTATDRDTTRDISVYLDVPPGHTFGTGVYSAEANGDPVAMETTGTGPARVGVDNDGGSCSGDTWLDVRDFHQTNGLVDRMLASFQLQCVDAARALIGEISIGEPASPQQAIPSSVRWARTTQPGGAGVVVPVTVRGDGPLGTSTARITGADAIQFRLRTTDCTGDVATADCTTRVQFAPTHAGPVHAALVVTTARGTSTVPLDGAGLPGSTSLAIRSDPGDYAGGGEQVHSTRAHYSEVALYGVPSEIEAAWRGWVLTFAPAKGQRLHVGTYRHAVYTPFRGNSPGIEVAGGGCNYRGRFTITQLAYDARHRVRRLDMTFDQHCQGSSAGLHGRLRWRAR